MAETTGISWCDATWNPWQGCHKVSEGCKFCYMYRDKERYRQDPSTVVRSAPNTFRGPLSKTRFPSGIKVFTCSWSDWFIEEADAWRDDAWEIIRQRPDLTFQILTKRPERILDHLPADWGNGWPNVWIGVSVETQRRADERIPLLLNVPAAVRFLSCEPLLGPLDLTKVRYQCVLDNVAPGVNLPFDVTINCLTGTFDDGEDQGQANGRITWVIAGGESGPKARPSHPDWFNSLRDQAQVAGVAFHFKQWGEHFPVYDRDRDDADWRSVPNPAQNEQWMNLAGGQGFHGDRVVLMRRVGVKHAGRELDGKVWDEMPVAGTLYSNCQSCRGTGKVPNRAPAWLAYLEEDEDGEEWFKPAPVDCGPQYFDCAECDGKGIKSTSTPGMSTT